MRKITSGIVYRCIQRSKHRCIYPSKQTTTRKTILYILLGDYLTQSINTRTSSPTLTTHAHNLSLDVNPRDTAKQIVNEKFVSWAVFFFSICAHYFANHILFLDNIVAFCTEPCLFSAIWYPYIYVNTWQKQAKINLINTLVISVTKSLDLFILIFHRIIFHHVLRNDIYLHNNKPTDFFLSLYFLDVKSYSILLYFFLKKNKRTVSIRPRLILIAFVQSNLIASILHLTFFSIRTFF